MSKQEYVAGFLFRRDDNLVALIKKNRPDWQAGKLNGIGGHIEDGETPLQAMKREFQEEAGLKISSWKMFAELEYSKGKVYFFKADFTYHGPNLDIQTMTDEKVGWHYVNGFGRIFGRLGEGVPNLRWLIPMAWDHDNVYAKIQDPT